MKDIKGFIAKWKGRGKEDEDDRSYWIDLFQMVLGVENGTNYLNFQKHVEINGHTKKIDAYVPEVRALIEQKSLGRSLTKMYRQSDGLMLTPIEQAQRYGRHLDYNEFPRWYITSNFEEIRIYDNTKQGSSPEIIQLEDLEKDYTRLGFLLDKKDEHIEKEKQVSVKAGELVGKLYDALLKEYNDPSDPETLKSLNILVVRLVFLMFADDSGIFEHNQFLDYMSRFRENPSTFRRELAFLFQILDTRRNEREPLYLDDEQNAFPWVNGGLFASKAVELPRFNEEIIGILLDVACAGFDWSDISPTIFGAVFESTLNAKSRREGGMHYTSLENIHKVIDPLFLNDLKQELEEIKAMEDIRGSRKRALNRFIDKLASLKFFDPACGSGNFLTETFLSLRRLENEALSILNDGQVKFATKNFNPIKVDITQLYGIEINDFAVAVANTALFIAEHQMLKETERILNIHINYLPLKHMENIHEGNALRMDWNDVLPASECSYIEGNPPFVGHQWRSKDQKDDMELVFSSLKNHKKLDYVCAWYAKASDYMKGTTIKAAFVSTNSIVQGESVPIIWEYLEKKDLHIIFAYQSFIWANETKNSAHVHCVIIGFSYCNLKNKTLYKENSSLQVDSINGYLLNGPRLYIKPRHKPIDESRKEMFKGNSAVDNGNLILNEQEYNDVVKRFPKLIKYLRPVVGSQELIKGIKRWCFWLIECPPKILNEPYLKERLKRVKEFRENSNRKGTKKGAKTPYLFSEIRHNGNGDYLLFPRVSSESRRYVPIGFINDGSIPLDSAMFLPNTDLYEFGILTSNVHNAWIRAVAGRLKSDYRYSNTVVYNNFPWPEPTEKQKNMIEKTAQNILDVRNEYPSSSLSDLYDELLMPDKLRKAHQANDRVVMEAYGFHWRTMTEDECVAELMKLYSDKIESEKEETEAKRRKR